MTHKPPVAGPIEQEEYWQTLLGDSLPVFDSILNRPRPPMQSFIRATETAPIDKSLSQKLNAFCTEKNVSSFEVMLAVFKIALLRYSGQDDVLLGTLAIIGESDNRIINPVPLRTNLADDPAGSKLLTRVSTTVQEAVAHRDYPFEKLVSLLNAAADFTRAPIFQLMLIPLNMPGPLLNAPLTPQDISEAGETTSRCDLVLLVSPTEITCEYDADLFDYEHIRRLLGHLKMLLNGFIENIDAPISTLSILTNAERHRLLVEWNNTRVDYPGSDPIHRIIELQTEQTPDAVAVSFEGQQLTYRQLNERANQLAHRLQRLGVGPETLVGVAMDRSLEMVIGLLATLKAGGAYVPIDPSYPAERVAFMLSDSAVPVLLTQSHLVPHLPLHNAVILCLDNDWPTIAAEDTANPPVQVTPNNLAYVIYTSGSTGKPKGAMNTHAAIRNRLLWMQDAYLLTSTDHILQKTPFSFDVSVWEFFWPLMFGARLVVAKPGGHQDSAYLVNIINAQQITTLHFVPSMLRVFLDQPSMENCTSLKRVICSGEALPLDLQNRFFAHLPQVELHNLYGPTEAAIDVTSWQCDPHSPLEIVPIGKPIANMQTFILDKHLQPVPIGAPGELHLGGIGLARGYHNRPQLTGEKFIPSPNFNLGISKIVNNSHFTTTAPETKWSGIHNSQLYKTGDLARYLPDGNIEYLGRLDFQVKIRGFRIELGEIEKLLDQHPVVTGAIVAVREDTPGNPQLVAYVIPAQPGGSTHQQLANILREYLQTKLPDYMVPAAFVLLEAFPLSPNGKINRPALPPPANVHRPQSGQSYVSPKTPTEETLAQIWANLLGLERVGTHDNFFELGGHSLLAAQLIARIRDTFHLELAIDILLDQAPTVAVLAQHIDAVLWTQTPVVVSGEHEEGEL